MKVFAEPKHPNALKILVASAISGRSLPIVQKQGVLGGAQLEVEGLYSISANSAVLYLLREASDQEVDEDAREQDEKWLQWESCELQGSLVPYLQSLDSGREDKNVTAALATVLRPFLSTLTDSGTLVPGKLTAADIVVLCSLLPLHWKPGANGLFRDCPDLINYLDKFINNEIVKSCVQSWYGSLNIELKPWVNTLVGPQDTCLPSSFELVCRGAQKQSPKHEQVTNKDVEVLTEEELAQACVSWDDGSLKLGVRKTKLIPVLPVAGQSNILVTSALPYVNNVPHLGNIIGCVLSADCFARFCRMRGDNVLYICGTDEYGTATETKAITEGLTPRQICDKYHIIHADIYRWFNISFDHFGRTTTDHQTKIAQDIFLSLERNKLIAKNSVDQLYCERCERFLADRFVEGTCPHLGCGYEDARGDQCDACGKLINATDLKNPRCKLCSDTPRLRTSKHLFLDLPKLETKLQSWIGQSSHHWSANAKVICDSWLRDGLKERCITRDLKWGTPVPLEGYTDKVFYVWYDAPIGYISITMDYTSQWEKWWKNQSQVKYYEFMAKDNVPFHSVVFPACQLGTGQPWTMVTHLSATEYLNFEDGKFSKSRCVGVFGDQVKDTGIPSDIWRFYLLYIRPEAHDTVFSWSDFQLKVNSELLNNIGNFVNRALKFVYQFFKGIVPNANPDKTDFAVMAQINKELKNYRDMLAVIKIRDGLRHILSITRIGNLYIQENEPFKLIKSDRIDDKQRAATVVNVSVNIVALVALILNPYMPETSAKVLEYLNEPKLTLHLPQNFTSLIPAGHVIKEPAPLIQKITDDQVARLRGQFAGNVISSNGPAEAPTIDRTPADGEVAQTKFSSSVFDGEVDVTHLQKLVSDQSNKVRDLKKSGLQKDVWQPEVSVLLALKEKMALAQGIAPSTGKSSSKDKKKKKK